MKLFSLLLGDEPGYLRLHNVLAFPFFSWGIWRLSRLINSQPLQWAFMAAALFNPYILDFFSVARGYGMAITFQVWSLFYFVKAAGRPFDFRSWLAVVLMNTLTAGANLSYFYTIMAMAGFYTLNLGYRQFRLQRPIHKKEKLVFLLFALLLTLVLADLLFIKYYGHDLEYGGADMINSMFLTVWQGSLYYASYSFLAPWLAYISFLFICAVCLYYCITALRHRQLTTGFLLCLPLLSILLLSSLFNLVTGTPFLTMRTALQWYIPGILLISFFLGEKTALATRIKPLLSICSFLVAAGIAMHFYTRADKSWCYEWINQCNTREAIYTIYAQQPKHPWLTAYTSGVFTNYYHITDSTHLSPWPEFVPFEKNDPNRAGLTKRLANADWIISSTPYLLNELQTINKQFEVLKTYPVTHYQLIKVLP
ncbi:MAG: hypothetical protein P0Y53_01135 [Candidatus Pseudobacter hemicellulosilyticus]|uniref:Uncharacterized protein n=1 Tax=Candidatus Pseudobacter hemicellulosilyticus TaxID=3121375 RepID=A0AAJ5WS97_9BACT|nr:MAG: hypothetical protein P0Y53_01135 [Pseudobacter sp.]